MKAEHKLQTMLTLVNLLEQISLLKKQVDVLDGLVTKELSFLTEKEATPANWIPSEYLEKFFSEGAAVGNRFYFKMDGEKE